MITIEDILNELIKHNPNYHKLLEVKKSYDLADEIHRRQVRQSGEPYIIHPLAVAKNLLDMEIYDPDSISAALLHDTIEDAKGKFSTFSKEDIAALINPTVAMLVDGVTKISRMNFNTKEEQNLANFRKIINGLTKDVRIILIKLADRLHNMRTLEYKKPNKQEENSKETLHLYVPLALSIGAYKTKSELEDLSFMYLSPDNYHKIVSEKSILEQYQASALKEIAEKTKAILNSKSIPNEIILRTKNAYSTYNRIAQGYNLENIYDLFYLKILVDEVEECYQTLGIVHKNYRPINGRFKDYIYNPRTNFYQSLHTTVSDGQKLVKVKIRTHNMDKISAHGISARWNIPDCQTIQESQQEICEKLQFAKKLIEIDESFADNHEFIEQVQSELLTEHVYVYNHSGEVIELPADSTPFDFICHTNPDSIDQTVAIIVNGKEVPLDYHLKNTDRIQVVTRKDEKEIILSKSEENSLQKIKL